MGSGQAIGSRFAACAKLGNAFVVEQDDQSPVETEAVPEIVIDPRNETTTSMGPWDPLRISYVLVMDDDRLQDMSMFQGFGRGWEPLLWALGVLSEMPETVVHPAWSRESVIRSRMGGASIFAWRPLIVSALETFAIDQIGFCVVLFTGTATAAARATTWAAAQPRPVLHVSNVERAGAIPMQQFDRERLRTFCRSVFEAFGHTISVPRLEMAMSALDSWIEPEPISSGIEEIGHNATIPNQMVLKRAGYGFTGQVPHWSSVEEAEYTRVIIESAKAVMAMRDEVGFGEVNRLYLPQPHIVLTEPAVYRSNYRREAFNWRTMSAGARIALRALQNQTGLARVMHAKDIRPMLEDPVAGAISVMRAAELKTQALGVGLMAANVCAAVLRLRPAVNKVFPLLSGFARNIRAQNYEARFKTPRLFARVQQELVDAVGPERIAFIEQFGGPIRIVADAPLELLPIGGLPLGLRYDCSRINATPGNLMMGEFVNHPPLHLTPAQLGTVLVVSSFAPGDRLRNLMERAIDAIGPQLRDRVTVSFVRVDTEEELVATVNASDAAILVVDAHGVADDGDGIGGIAIGDQSVNVWALRSRMRSPPIVILSACDTHSLDAASHSTVGNSFLALGARAVLATQLPIGGVEAGVFVGRLLYRLAEFLPAALSARKRVLNWSETVTGMLRMTLATELCQNLLAKAPPARLQAIAAQANLDINSGVTGWFERLLDRIAAELKVERDSLKPKVLAAIARSEAIRYVHLGHPASILIDDGQIQAQFIPPGLPEKLGIAPLAAANPVG